MAHHRTKGFTLIEVLVAVSIFTLAIVGLLSVVATSQRNFIEAKLISKAIFLAEQKMNEVYRVGYQAIDEDDDTYILDEDDEENAIEIIVREGEFYNEDYYDYEKAEKEGWLNDYYWQVIIKESEDLAGMQMVIVRVFNKNLNGRNEYTDMEYGRVTELVTYISATKQSQEKEEDE